MSLQQRIRTPNDDIKCCPSCKDLEGRGQQHSDTFTFPNAPPLPPLAPSSLRELHNPWKQRAASFAARLSRLRWSGWKRLFLANKQKKKKNPSCINNLRRMLLMKADSGSSARRCVGPQRALRKGGRVSRFFLVAFTGIASAGNGKTGRIFRSA